MLQELNKTELQGTDVRDLNSEGVEPKGEIFVENESSPEAIIRPVKIDVPAANLDGQKLADVRQEISPNGTVIGEEPKEGGTYQLNPEKVVLNHLLTHSDSNLKEQSGDAHNMLEGAIDLK